MIILGDKYKLNKIELNQIQKKYSPNHISLENKSTEQIIKELSKLCKNQKYKLIILNTKANIPDELIKYLTSLELKGIKFLTIEHFLEKYLGKVYIPRDGSNIDFLDQIKSYKQKQLLIKRIIDFSISIPLGIISMPIMLYAAYRIKKESPEGPVIFKQKRIGLNGKEFVCYKFRSMVPDAEKGKPKFASKDDPRVFKWGAFMRKTRIDELPQLWNVIKGDMHLIGPRPERKYWIDIFEKNIPYYNLRHIVKPGITGWAQVCYPYGANEEDAYQKLLYDLYYIKNWSFWLEMKTIFKTILVMFGKKGI
ncbi:sugar transferase [Nautilia sp. PV-1]|nr:sugar transferase [Nautilia sp. PV-1]